MAGAGRSGRMASSLRIDGMIYGEDRARLRAWHAPVHRTCFAFGVADYRIVAARRRAQRAEQPDEVRRGADAANRDVSAYLARDWARARRGVSTTSESQVNGMPAASVGRRAPSTTGGR
jgi:hypothetical protein